MVTFRQEAVRALKLVPGAWISLIDLDGQIVLTTAPDAASPLPRHPAPDVSKAAIASGEPQVADVLFGPAAKKVTSFVEVPVLGPDQKIPYTLAISLSPDRFHALLSGRYTKGEVIGVIDRQHRFIARLPEHEKRIGTLASDGWRAAIAKASEGVISTLTVDGYWALTGYARTARGWTVGVGQQEAEIARPANSIWQSTAAGAVILTLLSLGLGLFLAQRASGGMANLARQARLMPEGGPYEEQPASFAEAETISDALRTASKEIQRINSGLESKVAERTSELKAEMRRREETETTLRQAQKMDSIGQLTGGIAHDFNNMLTIILGNLDTAQRRMKSLENSAPLTRPIEAAIAGTRNAAKLTHRLLAFARQQPLEPGAIQLNSLVAGLSDMLARTVGETIKVETVSGAGLWTAYADVNQLESCLVNLAINARDAMSDFGKLTIETGNAYLDDEYAARFGDVKAGQYVMLSVSDTGSGIAPELIDKVFEPFFTTKDAGKGTGLGLAMVHGFVKQSGGHIRLYSEVGEGTTVRLYLPKHEQTGVIAVTPRGEAVEAEVVPRARSGEVIMVVEDEAGVREYAVGSLEDLGYHVVSAAGASEALQLMQSTDRIDLLFTDVVLGGGMSGRQLADEITVLRPTLPVLFTTGYTRNAIVHQGRLDNGVQLLGKPYTQRELGIKIRSVLKPPDRFP